MKRTFQVSLAVTLAAISLQAFVPAPLAAQPPEPGFVLDPPNLAKVVAPIPAPYTSIDSINAATRRVTLREFKFSTDRKSIPGNSVTLPLAANASVVRLEPATSADQLRVFDKVTLLGRRAPVNLLGFTLEGVNGNVTPLTPQTIKQLIIAGGVRSTSKAEEFEIVSVFPQLTLRRGGVPADASGNTSFVRTPFSNGGEGNIGFLSLDRAVDGAQTVVTLVLTKTEELKFIRFAPVTLREIVPLLAARKIYIKAEFSHPGDGQREVTRLLVWDAK